MKKKQSDIQLETIWCVSWQHNDNSKSVIRKAYYSKKTEADYYADLKKACAYCNVSVKEFKLVPCPS